MTKAKLNKLIALATANVEATRQAVDAACQNAPDSLWVLFMEDRGSVIDNPTAEDLETAKAQREYNEAKRLLKALQIFEARSIAVKVAYVPAEPKAN